MRLHFSKSCDTFVMKYKIICTIPQVAITIQQYCVSIKLEKVLMGMQRSRVQYVQYKTGFSKSISSWDANVHSRVLLKLLNKRANSWGKKSPQAHPSSPPFSAVCLKHLCALNSPRHVPQCLRVGFNEHIDIPLCPFVPCSPRHPCVLHLSAFLPSQCIQSYLPTCPQPSGWQRPGETLLQQFHLLHLLTSS